jgi:hypothetical protein
MQKYLNDKFTLNLYAQIDALQINQVELPQSFQDAILESISTKQNITRSVRYKENMQVTFATQRMIAEQSANQTVIRAGGIAAQKMQQARANAQMTEQTVTAEIAAYTNITKVRASTLCPQPYFAPPYSARGRGRPCSREPCLARRLPPGLWPCAFPPPPPTLPHFAPPSRPAACVVLGSRPVIGPHAQLRMVGHVAERRSTPRRAEQGVFGRPRPGRLHQGRKVSASGTTSCQSHLCAANSRRGQARAHRRSVLAHSCRLHPFAPRSFGPTGAVARGAAPRASRAYGGARRDMCCVRLS